MVNVEKIKETVAKHFGLYNETTVMHRFKENKFVIDNKEYGDKVICLIKIKDLPFLLALVQKDKININEHAYLQFVRFTYLDERLNLHISDTKLFEEPVYNFDNDENIKKYNWTSTRFNLGVEVDKMYYKDGTKIYDGKRVFKVLG